MITDNDDSWSVLQKVLDKIQNNVSIRRSLAILLVAALLGVASYFVYGLLPRKYTLKISGGGILTERHHLAKVLQNEAVKSGLTLEIHPVQGSVEILKAVSDGKLALALVQGGLEKNMPNISHVAMLPPEMVHVIVKPGIKEMGDLKGKVINMGTTGGGTRIVAKEILNFFGLEENTDFVETNYSEEQLVNMHPDKLPDAIISISYVPSYLADYFIKERRFKLLDVPYPKSLGLRHTWTEESQILQRAYSVTPPVPEEDVTTVGVKLEIIANTNADPRAISKFLEVLYSSSIENVIKQTLEEETGNSFSEYPLSAGTVAYMKRNEPLFSMESMDQLKNLFGSVMAFLSTFMVVIRWFKGKKKEEENTASSEETHNESQDAG